MAIKSSNQITFTEHKKIVEIKEWYLATSLDTGITIDTKGWTTDVQTIDYANKYLWNYEEVVYSIGSSDISEPVIVGFYGKGDSGRGIEKIENYYQITKNLVAPDLPTSNSESKWSSNTSVITQLSPTNKYLWNYEAILYTDGTSTATDPAIIGIYGDSGTDAITFEIYSTHGFMFKKDLQSIELKIAAFEGAEAIAGAKYTWSWWDNRLNDGKGDYKAIVEDTTEQNLIVKKSDEYALASLKCTMIHNGKTYEDYIVLTDETVVYTSVVKFFDGRNIFYSDDLYLVAYIELYQNNHKIETIFADEYCSGISSVSESGVITANIDKKIFSDGDRMYFICENNNSDDMGLYKVVLGEFTSNAWKVVNVETEYVYTNSLYSDIQSNVVAISKESINKSSNIDFYVLKNNVQISNTNTNIIDSNDPIIGGSKPTNAVNGQLWLDTSVSPHILKIYDGEQWTECTEQIGGAVFTSKPSSYSKGDLWILAKDERCGNFGPGSMLKSTKTSSTFKESHWIDADAETTELKNNIKQYFAFDPDSGLRIGQVDDKFYVNISATEMGFYDNNKGQHQKVVKISNNSATIQSAKLKGNTEFYGQIHICDSTSDPEDDNDDALFIWKVEANKSLSLAIAT